MVTRWRAPYSPIGHRLSVQHTLSRSGTWYKSENGEWHRLLQMTHACGRVIMTCRPARGWGIRWAEVIGSLGDCILTSSSGGQHRSGIDDNRNQPPSMGAAPSTVDACHALA